MCVFVWNNETSVSRSSQDSADVRGASSHTQEENSQSLFGLGDSWANIFDDSLVLGFCLKCLHNLRCWRCTDAELELDSQRLKQIQWSVPGLCLSQSFLSAPLLRWQKDPVRQGQSSAQGFQGFPSGPGTSTTDAFTTPRPPQSAFLLFPLCPGDYPPFPPFVVKLTDGTFNDACCGHIDWTRWLFCDCFLSSLHIDSSPLLNDCTYPGLCVAAFPNARIRLPDLAT